MVWALCFHLFKSFQGQKHYLHMRNCKALPAARLSEVRKSLVNDFKCNRKQPECQRRIGLGVILLIVKFLFSEENGSHMCYFQGRACPDQPATVLNPTYCESLSEQSFIDLSEAKSKYRKMGFPSCILLTLSVHVFQYKSGTTIYLQITFKSQSPN